MAVTLRLMRFGKKKFPQYRIIALDKRNKRDGSYLDNVGTYNPLVNPPAIELKKDRYEYWTSKGAIISEGLRKLLKGKKAKFV